MKKLCVMIALFALFTLPGCEKQKGEDQQTPNSSPTSTSPMNPK